MCFHSRLIHGCGHYQWGGVFVPCLVEDMFNKGKINEGCSAMWSHGFCTISTAALCPKCLETKAKTDDKLAAIKARLQALKSTIGARPTKKSEGEADSPAGSDAAAVASSSSTPESTPEEDSNVEDDEDDEVHEVMEEIQYLYSEVSYDSLPEQHPVPEQPVPEQPVPEQPVPEHPDAKYRPLKLGRQGVLARDPVISQSTRWGRRWISA